MGELPTKAWLGYNICDFCKASGLGRTTAYELIRSGRLSVIRIGRRTIITAESARELFAGDRTAPKGVEGGVTK